MANVDNDLDFVQFMGGRVLGAPSAEPLTTNGSRNPSLPAAQQSAPQQPQTKAAISVLYEYVQRGGHIVTPDNLSYSFKTGQGFCATVKVHDRFFEDTIFYVRKQDAKESVSRVALAALLDGYHYVPVANTASPAAKPASPTAMPASPTATTYPHLSPVIDRKLAAWLVKNNLSPDGEPVANPPSPIEFKRPVTLLNELCQLLNLPTKFNVMNDPEGLYVCSLLVGTDHAYVSPSSSHRLNECKDAVARLALKGIITDTNALGLRSGSGSGSGLSTIPAVTSTVPSAASPTPQELLPKLYSSDGKFKSHVSLLLEICNLRKLGVPEFAFSGPPTKVGYVCKVSFDGGMGVINGTKRFPKKMDAKEHTAKLAYEAVLAGKVEGRWQLGGST